jgi:outer membrane biogenesis lipoprotein LolB
MKLTRFFYILFDILILNACSSIVQNKIPLSERIIAEIQERSAKFKVAKIDNFDNSGEFFIFADFLKRHYFLFFQFS